MREHARACLVTIVLTMGGCALPTEQLVESRTTFEHAQLPRVDVMIKRLRREGRAAARMTEASLAALRLYGEWFGALDARTLVIASSSVPARLRTPDAIVVDAAVFAPAASADIEQQVFRALAERYWGVPRDGNGERRGLAQGLAQFSADRLMRTHWNRAPRFGIAAVHGWVVWPVRDVPMSTPPADSTREGLALTTLERYLGWASLQQVLFEVRSRGVNALTATTLIDVAAELTARDIGWAIDLFDTNRRYDFAVDSIDVQPIDSGYVSTATVRRVGNGRFGPLPVRFRFADGETIDETWRDQRDEMEFAYQARTPLVEAAVDPDHVVAVEDDIANNVLTRSESHAESVAAQWALRWGMWLQDRLLLWSVLF